MVVDNAMISKSLSNFVEYCHSYGVNCAVLCTFASGFLSGCQSRRGGVSEREIATVIIVEAKFRFAGDEPSKQAEKSDVCYFLLDSYLRMSPCLGPSKTRNYPRRPR